MAEVTKVIGCRGCGSAIAEAFLTLANIPFDREEVNYDEPGPARDRLAALNPLVQVPTLVLPDQKILTETLAVAAYAQSQSGDCELIPKDPKLIAQFWRWATFIIAAVYPTFTYGDNTKRWVSDETGSKQLRESTDELRKKLLKVLEGETQEPYFLGNHFSAIDIYLTAMSHWRPGRSWFQNECPRIFALSEKVKSDPRLKAIWNYHQFS
jgi:GST-like protein